MKMLYGETDYGTNDIYEGVILLNYPVQMPQEH